MMKSTRRIFMVVLGAMLALQMSVAVAQTDFWQLSYPDGFTRGPGFAADGSVLVTGFNTPGGLSKSADGGTNWHQTRPDIHVSCFATAPNGNVYGGSTGVFRSTDAGEHWAQLPSSAIYPVNSLAVNPDGYLYVGIHPWNAVKGGIYRSTDDGLNWTRLPLGSTSARFVEVNSITVIPNGDILASMYSTFNRVFISHNKGNNWRHVALPISRGWWWNFAVASNGDLLAAADVKSAAGTLSKIYRSTNGGIRWTAIHTFPGSIFLTSIAATASGDIYVSSSQGVFQSTDNGSTFAAVNSGLSGGVFTRSLTLSPDGYLYTIIDGGGLFRSQQVVGLPPSKTSSRPSIEEDRPAEFRLNQNYPNPFNPTTTIEFELAQDAIVTAKVYNMIGQEVAELIHSELMDEGMQELEFDASNLPSGVYYYRIVAADVEGKSVLYSNVKKMLLLK